jgi:hypothetical protein
MSHTLPHGCMSIKGASRANEKEVHYNVTDDTLPGRKNGH